MYLFIIIDYGHDVANPNDYEEYMSLYMSLIAGFGYIYA